MDTVTQTRRLLGFAPLFALSLMLSIPASAEGPDGEPRHPRGPVSISDAEIRLNDRFNLLDADDSESISFAEFEAGADDQGGPGADRRHGKHFKERRQHRAESGSGGESHGHGERRDAFEAELFAAMDLDGNGELSTEEASRENRRTAQRGLMLSKRFERLDSNSDGSLDRGEFAAQLERLRAADADANGEVTREEFRAQVRARREARS